MYKFYKMNRRPLKLYYNTKHIYFYYCKRRYNFEDIIRVHNNPMWFGDDSNYPDFIAGVSQEYYHPIFIELLSDEYINVYRTNWEAVE